jgi:NAD(P)-dependent dehydrogenase (short-subunit alcohol dehydrogenase family)
MARTFVVVGASTGLGRETARALVRSHRVIVAGRDVERTRAAVPGAHAALRVDLADLGDVARFTDELAAHGPLHGVVCNAGIQHTSATVTTRDGFEETFAVNHLAHFAIATRVVPQLARGARLVFVGSGTADPDDRGARRFGFRGGRYSDARALARGDAEPGADAGQIARDRYATSKLCNLLTVAAIARRVPPARFAAFAIDPGLMPGTGLARHRSAVVRLLWHTVMRVAGLAMPGASSARRSAAALAWILTSPELEGTTGRYFDFRRRELTRWFGVDRTDWSEELYTGSLALCGIEHDPLRAAA